SGAGVYYGAAITEAASCKSKEVYIVGGGNSAGQAAMFLAQYARRVNILIRGVNLTSTMSSYLIDQINATENIVVHGFTEILQASGNEKLEKIKLRNNADDSERVVETDTVFIFIGTKPFTSWLPSSVIKNDKDF